MSELLPVGTPVRYRDPNGSWGKIEAHNHYGGYYVRWNYGRDVKGEPITDLCSIQPREVEQIPQELYDRYVAQRAWSEEQHAIERELPRG